jgi:hypothetical protein
VTDHPSRGEIIDCKHKIDGEITGRISGRCIHCGSVVKRLGKVLEITQQKKWKYCVGYGWDDQPLWARDSCERLLEWLAHNNRIKEDRMLGSPIDVWAKQHRKDRSTKSENESVTRSVAAKKAGVKPKNRK